MEPSLWGPPVSVLEMEKPRQRKPSHSSEREAGMWEQKEALGRAWTANHLWGTPTEHSCWERFLAHSTSALLVLLFPQCHFPLCLTSPLERAASSRSWFTSFAAPSHPEACESRQCPFTQDSHGQISDTPFGWTSPEALGPRIRPLLKHGGILWVPNRKEEVHTLPPEVRSSSQPLSTLADRLCQSVWAVHQTLSASPVLGALHRGKTGTLHPRLSKVSAIQHRLLDQDSLLIWSGNRVSSLLLVQKLPLAQTSP